MTKTTTTDTSSRILRTMSRLHLDKLSMSAYLGVPPQTLHNWIIGTREPNRAVVRLLDVLDTIEAVAPGIHTHLIPAPKTPGKRGRKPKNQSAT